MSRVLELDQKSLILSVLSQPYGCRSLSLVLLDNPLSISLEFKMNTPSFKLPVSNQKGVLYRRPSLLMLYSKQQLSRPSVATNIEKFRCVQIYC
ncbi:hypothetical protein KCU89_g37, partial [Aureobasidium melanogenum]